MIADSGASNFLLLFKLYVIVSKIPSSQTSVPQAVIYTQIFQICLPECENEYVFVNRVSRLMKCISVWQYGCIDTDVDSMWHTSPKQHSLWALLRRVVSECVCVCDCGYRLQSCAPVCLVSRVFLVLAMGSSNSAGVSYYSPRMGKYYYWILCKIYHTFIFCGNIEGGNCSKLVYQVLCMCKKRNTIWIQLKKTQ